MNTTALVTCIYNGLSDTKYGGRNRESMYKDSLSSIAEAGLPIFCYTFPKDSESLQHYFISHGIHNIKVIPHDILSEDFHVDIMRIKNEHPEIYYTGDKFWRDRCPEIMWGKTRMIQRVINDNENLRKIYWIDAGLSNASILRHKYFPEYDSFVHYKSSGFYTSDFFHSLDRHSRNGMFAAFHTNPNNTPIPEKFNHKPYGTTHYAMIGGLFGGNVDLVSKFCSMFEVYIDKMLSAGVLYSEESAYTGIANDNPEMFNPMIFDTFYNEDWKDIYNSNDISFAAILDEMRRE